jgi:cytochrome c
LAFSVPLVYLAGLLGGGPLWAQASGGAQHTVWDGVYSETQARRGELVFKAECSYCHKEDLSGGFFDDGLGRAPALAGKRAFDSSFLDRWGGMTLADLVSTIAATMPQKRPASLTLDNYIDLASYVLAKNDVPAGTSDLPSDVDALTRIAIVPRASAQDDPRPYAGW